jgi:hypothetical protein
MAREGFEARRGKAISRKTYKRGNILSPNHSTFRMKGSPDD